MRIKEEVWLHESINASLNIIDSFVEEGRKASTTSFMLHRTTLHHPMMLAHFSHHMMLAHFFHRMMRFMYSCIHVCIYIVGMKQSRKIYVPVKEHPEINYLGLLIGPQGSTQKQLSASTGARIVIRGRGSSSSNNSNDIRNRHEQ